MQNIWDKLQNLYEKRALYYLYFIGFAIVLIVAIVSESSDEMIALKVLGFFIILVPAVVDFCRIIANIINNQIVKFVITIIPFSYIIYGIAEFLSKEHIRAIVDFIPDSFTTAIYFFTMFYIFYVLGILFICFLLIALIAYIIFILLKDIKFVWNILNKLEERIVRKFDFKNKIHMGAFCMFGLVSIYFFIIIFIQTPSFYLYKYTSVIIHYTSYYENGTICSKIDKKYYIKTLGDNQVSISPFVGKINDNIIGQHNKDIHTFLFFAYRENEEVGQDFITRQCN